jgi:hypothetical protein
MYIGSTWRNIPPAASSGRQADQVHSSHLTPHPMVLTYMLASEQPVRRVDARIRYTYHHIGQ